MTMTIPGRRISYGETFYTDWIPRGGDCAILRAQVLMKNASGGSVRISLETRSEEGTSANPIDTYYPSSAPKLLELSGVVVGAAIYLPTKDTSSPLRGFQEQVRAKVTVNGGSAGDYWVVRLFPPIFFDNSIEA
jgi:hypothetical protein